MKLRHPQQDLNLRPLGRSRRSHCLLLDVVANHVPPVLSLFLSYTDARLIVP